MGGCALHDEFDGLSFGGDGGAKAIQELSSKVEKGMGSIVAAVKDVQAKQAEQKTAHQELLENYGQLTKETKSAMEELTKVKNAQNDAAGTLTALKKFEAQMKREARLAYGDPIAKLLADPERVLKINAIARHLTRAPLSERQSKALTGGSGVGATLIDEQFETEMYDILSRYGKWSGLGVRQIGKATASYPVKTARPVAKFFRKIAGAKIPEGTKTGTRSTVTPEPLGVLILADEELLKDSEIDLSRDIMNDFVESMNLLMDFMAFVADGTDDADHGAFTGLFNGGTAAVAAATHTTIGSLGLADFLLCLTTVAPVVLERQAKWWMHPYNLARSIGIKDDNGRPLFQTALEAPSFGAVGSILGYPLELIHVGPSTDAASQQIAAFGDPQAQLVPVRQGFEFAESADWKFDDYQRAFRVVGRACTATRAATSFAVLTTPAA